MPLLISRTIIAFRLGIKIFICIKSSLLITVKMSAINASKIWYVVLNYKHVEYTNFFKYFFFLKGTKQCRCLIEVFSNLHEHHICPKKW
jgi:hypothetical protein